MTNSSISHKRDKALGKKLLKELRLSIKGPAQRSLFPCRVFLSHGRDIAAKETVARFIEELGLEVVIPHEQPSRGRTIVEKFENYSDVDFAIVLLTPDEMDASIKKKTATKPRPLQNVMFEFGYFVGRLGRNRVCVLHKRGVEIPSDYQGILYIPMDLAGMWKVALAREIISAGIDVDLNKL